jgi:hypothetical protein
MNFKNVTLKVPLEEHARMVDAAKREFIPLTALLRRLFDDYDRGDVRMAQTKKPARPPRTQPQQTPTPEPVKPTPANYELDLDGVEEDIKKLFGGED